MDKNKNLDELFRLARNQQPKTSFVDTKALFIESLNNPVSIARKNQFLLTKKWIIMFVFISTTAVTCLLLFNSEVKNKKVEPISIETEKNQIQSNSTQNVSTFSEQTTKVNFKAKSLEKNHFLSVNNPILPNQDFIDFNAPSFQNKSAKMPKYDDVYVFPILTKEEIDATLKQKKEMLKALEKIDKKVYSYIPSGTFDYNGKQTSVQSFVMQKTEVSNLEYRTFLFDLLIQNRKDEFLIAKPDHKQWSILSNQENCPLEQHYFSHPAYDHYPVVNISRAGAELFCKWLTQEINKKIASDKKRNPFNDVRIPSRTEWVMAASVEGAKSPYPWGGPFMRNSEGLFLANFRMPKEESNTIADKSNDLLAPVNSYFPNDHGLYNLSGNAAEMVYNDNEVKTSGTAGGSWFNTAEELKINAPDTFDGITTASPKIGFRVVMTVIK